MAIIKPFKAIRPMGQYVENVATLPYDVFSEEEARNIVKKNPQSFLKVVRPETVFPEGTDIYGDMVYEKAKEILDLDMKNGILTQEENECYYIYRQIMGDRSQTGVVACFSVDDYLNNVIRKHEHTRPEKEKDRTTHIDICSAQTGLVFLAFQEKYDISSILAKITAKAPLYDFISADNVKQTVWKVEDAADIDQITKAFAEMKSLYIADGHHRCASAASICRKRRAEHPDFNGSEEFNYLLAVAFPQDQLLIYPYNRVVKDLNGLTDEKFLEEIEKNGFSVEKVSAAFIESEKKKGSYKPAKKGEFAMYLSGNWYRLTAKTAIQKTDAVGCLDVSLLQENILDKILGIKDPRTDKRIEFVGGIRGFGELEKRCSQDMKVGFALYPTSMDELFRVTDEGQVMPPKSTWFEPKLQSGLFIHRI